MIIEGKKYLEASLQWIRREDAEYPYEAQHDGHQLLVRLNDFPAEELYSLIEDGKEVTTFDDWPASWTRLGEWEVSLEAILSSEQTRHEIHSNVRGDIQKVIETEELSKSIPLTDILQGISPDELNILFLALVNEMSITEIAENRGQNKDLVRYTLNKARSKIRANSRKRTDSKSLSKKDT